MSWKDRLARYPLYTAQHVVPYGRWFRELRAYHRGSFTPDEFWVRYTLSRHIAATLWSAYARQSEKDRRAFYNESDFWLYRQAYVHRRSTFYWILDALPGPWFCEYGCGIAPVSAWLARRRNLLYTLVDVPSAMFDFAKWRMKGAEALTPGLGNAYPLTKPYDGIACLDVLEHVPDPLTLVKHLVVHLAPGGTLFVNFRDGEAGEENLESAAAQRGAVLDYLYYTLTPIRPITRERDEPHAVYRKTR